MAPYVAASPAPESSGIFLATPALVLCLSLFSAVRGVFRSPRDQPGLIQLETPAGHVAGQAVWSPTGQQMPVRLELRPQTPAFGLALRFRDQLCVPLGAGSQERSPP